MDVNVWKWITGFKTRRTLKALRKHRYVDTATDPSTGLTIYKYSRGFSVKAFRHPEMWTPLMLTLRGAVYDRYGHKVNGNMAKFFNHNEPNAATMSLQTSVLEKLDGSCVQVFLYNHKPVVTTLGSFQSEQAVAAKQWLKNTFGFSWIVPEITYVFEWMDPKNFTTLTYKGEQNLVLIGMFINGKGREVGVKHAPLWGWKGDVVRTVPLPNLSYEDLANRIQDDEEGYVLVDTSNRDANTGQRYRVKVKGEEFLRLHRAKWGVTPLKIYEWTYGLSPRTVAYDELDEETKVYVDSVQASLTSKLAALCEEGRRYLYQLKDVSNKHEIIKTFPKEHQSFVYASLGGKGDLAIRQYIRMIRPTPDEYPLGGVDENS